MYDVPSFSLKEAGGKEEEEEEEEEEKEEEEEEGIRDERRELRDCGVGDDLIKCTCFLEWTFANAQGGRFPQINQRCSSFLKSFPFHAAFPPGRCVQTENLEDVTEEI